MSDCKYFPCHDLDKEEFDCSLCYCPFYKICGETENYNLFGGYILKQNNLLACEKCVYFHRKSNVDVYNKLKEQGKTTEEIYKYFVEKEKENK